MTKVRLSLIEEERPFLVAGLSEVSGDWVFGFPYFHKEETENGMCKYCRCIILPTPDDGIPLPDDGMYDFAVKRGEFHPVKGEFKRFVREENGRYIFEDGITFHIG